MQRRNFFVKAGGALVAAAAAAAVEAPYVIARPSYRWRSRKVHESFASYQAKLSPWAGISEGPYHRLIRA